MQGFVLLRLARSVIFLELLRALRLAGQRALSLCQQALSEGYLAGVARLRFWSVLKVNLFGTSGTTDLASKHIRNCFSYQRAVGR
jgi:hypothetical protein